MDRKQRIEEELAKLGIYTIEDLNEAIKKEKDLDLSLMTKAMQADSGRKAG